MGIFERKPFIQKNLPSAPKPEPLQKPAFNYKKMDLVKGSWLKGSQASMNDIKRYFRRPEVRADLRRRLGIPQNDTTQLDKHIKSMMEMIPNKFGTGYIDKDEVLGREFKERKYWGVKHDILKKSEGGFTQE